MIIGLTGTSCAGKNEVASIMEGFGFFVVDEDRLGHLALERNREKIIEAFSSAVLTEDGARIDRKKLGPVVFSSPEGLRKLEAISHPWMVCETLRLCREAEKKGLVAVINAAILEKMGLDEYSDEIVLVDAPYEVRLQRALARDGISEEKFQKRCASQKDIGKKSETLGKKVVRIVNDGDKKHLYRQIKDYCDKILALRGSAWASN